MIKVNLCPSQELENPYWYAPDLALFLAVALMAYFGVRQYLGTIEADIRRVNDQIASLEDSTKKLEPDLKRFSTLDEDIKELNTKLEALRSITVSKIERYKLLIALEHFQTLKPLGLWYQSLDVGVEAPEKFRVKGQSFDNILTAEFMTALRATGSQEIDGSDLRTQVYFQNLSLVSAALRAGDVPGVPDLKNLPAFEVVGLLQSRTTESAKPEPKAKAGGKNLSQREGGSAPNQGTKDAG
jgi:hypothetical protein